MISNDEVRHIAKLAKINISDADIPRFAQDLSGILDHVEMMSEVNTDGVAETSQVTGMTNRFQDDVIEVQGHEKELVQCSPHPKSQNCVQLPKIM